MLIGGFVSFFLALFECFASALNVSGECLVDANAVCPCGDDKFFVKYQIADCTAAASRAASAIKPCRAARAAAVSPVAGLSPSQLNPPQSAPAFRAARRAKSVQRPLSAFSR